MITEEMVDLQCSCGGLLIAGGNLYRCADCGRRYCADYGGEVIVQGGCSVCLSCAVSSCGV